MTTSDDALRARAAVSVVRLSFRPFAKIGQLLASAVASEKYLQVGSRQGSGALDRAPYVRATERSRQLMSACAPVQITTASCKTRWVLASTADKLLNVQRLGVTEKSAIRACNRFLSRIGRFSEPRHSRLSAETTLPYLYSISVEAGYRVHRVHGSILGV